MKESFYDFKAKDIQGNEVSMNDLKDKVNVIVKINKACKENEIDQPFD